MPKYLTRQEFESTKVLRNRKYTIQEIAKKLWLSPATVSRNLKYRSYDDYCLSMHAKSTKGGNKVESKSGECRTVGKTCHKCGKAKMLSEFDKKKQSKDGYSNMCKACRAAYQREWERKRKAAEEMEEKPKSPELQAWDGLIEKLKEMPQPILEDDPCEAPKAPKFDIGDKVCVRAGFDMSAYGVISKLLESPDDTTYYEVKYRLGRFLKKTHTLIAGEDVIFKVIKEE